MSNMSGLARSLADSLRLDDDETRYHENDVAPDLEPQSSTARHETPTTHHEQVQSPSSPSPSPEEDAQAQGVKDDFTELRQKLTRQYLGVANFLAPPPEKDHPHRLPDDRSASDLNRSEQPEGSSLNGESMAYDSEEVPVIGAEVAETGGSFRSGESEIANMASNRVPLEWEENDRENQLRTEELEYEEEEEEDEEAIWENVVGITDEVLTFATNIAMHPETWLDFPLDPDEDPHDFDMSDAQRGHALVIERLAPRLAALRIELCPCHMSESYFWKVYFVLLHSRLNKHDAALLSSPQVMEARALWRQELHKKTNPETDWFGRSISSVQSSNNIPEDEFTPTTANNAPPEFLSPRIYSFEPPSIMKANDETIKHPYETTETQFIDKAVIEEEPVLKTEKDLIAGPSSKIQIPNYEDEEDDDWLKDGDSVFGEFNRPSLCIQNDEDLSFSDLEADDDISNLRIKSKMAAKATEPCTAQNP